MALNIVEEDLRRGISLLTSIGTGLASIEGRLLLGGLEGFSTVSGLDQSGNAHGRISGTNKPESNKALSSHILDTATMAEASLDNMIGADGAISRFVGQIGLGNQFGASASAVDMDMKMAQVENPTTNPFVFGQPIAGFVPSLSVLNGQFQLTDPTQAASEAAAWQSTASSITSVISELGGVLAALSSSAETDWVKRAIERINRIQWAGGQYAAHATAMALHTGNLATVAGAEKIATSAAFSTWIAAPVAVKPILEQAYMAAFTPRLNAGLVPTVPTFNQLLPPLDAMPGTTYQPGALQVPPTPSFDRSPLPQVVRDALSANGYKDLAYAETPSEIVEQYGLVNPQVSDYIAPGSTPTQAASAVATLPHAPQGLAAPSVGASVGGASGIGSPAFQSAGLGGGNAGGAFASGTAGGFAPTTGATRGIGRASGLAAGNAPGRANGLGRADGSAMGAGLGRGGGLGSSALSGAAMGGGAGGMLGSMGRAGAGSSGFSTGIAPGAAVNAPSAGIGLPANGQGGQGSQGGARAVAMGGPMAPGAGVHGNGGAKRRKIRSVTSAVERQGNLRELLGEAPAVLPDVIGEAVRAPR